MATQTSEKPKSAPKSRARAEKRDDAAPKAEQSARKPEPQSGGYSTGMLVGTAAVGAMFGVAAMIGRKFAVQAPTIMAGDWDKALAAEHKAVLAIFDVMEKTTSANTTKRAILLAQMKHALSKHALQEENTVYPALREIGEVEAADQLNGEHGYVKQYLYELTNCPKNSDKFLEILARFRVDLEKHVDEEENQLYPELKAKLSVEQNKMLTTAMNKEGFKLA